MTAFQVSPAHIARVIAIADALRCGGINHAPSPYMAINGMEPGYTDTNEAIFGLLARANAASVGYRYSESADPVPYEAPQRVRLDTLADIVAAVKVIDCYVYQSCEVPGFASSTVGQWCSQIRETLIRCLPGFAAAYSSAPWSITSQVAA